MGKAAVKTKVKAKVAPTPVVWKDQPDNHDYPAAWRYLTLHFKPTRAAQLFNWLQQAKMTKRADKDILRAAGLTLLPPDDSHVIKNLNKIKSGKAMTPVLLVVTDGKTYIADGYHRVCALWHLNYDELIPCRIIWADGNSVSLGAEEPVAPPDTPG